jgi:hypothetical protein
MLPLGAQGHALLEPLKNLARVGVGVGRVGHNTAETKMPWSINNCCALVLWL